MAPLATDTGRLVATIGVAALLLAACTAKESTDAAPDGAGGKSVVLEPVESTPREDVPSALDDPAGSSLPKPLVDVDRIISGGPPPDGIPAIDQPRFERAEEVAWLADSEPVVSLTLGGVSRAYPIQVLTWHEIVNDTVAGQAVAVTYCPLCNSSLAFDRRLGERLVTFGTSGMLYKSDLVMYDRQTESLWSQLEGRAIAGLQAGTELRTIPVSQLPWATWRQENPDGWVLSRDTGHDRPYGQNPYVGYDEIGSDPFLLDERPDDRLPPKERVVAFPAASESIAIRLQDVADSGVVLLRLDGDPIAVFGQPGLASALDTRSISDGREIAATAAFRAEIDGRQLQFEADGEWVVDTEGTRWDLLGRAVSGPGQGRALEPITHVDTFWFAWAAFRPDTKIWEP